MALCFMYLKQTTFYKVVCFLLKQFKINKNQNLIGISKFVFSFDIFSNLIYNFTKNKNIQIKIVGEKK